MASSAGLVLVGLLLLVLGGELLLRGAVTLATIARVTPGVIGLTVVAAGTSVPEFVVSLIATARGNDAVAVGNVVGSNIFNVTFILGVAALVRPLKVGGETVRLEYPVLALVTSLFLLLSVDGSIGRLDASLFVAIYVGFTAHLVRLARGRTSLSEDANLRGEVDELTPKLPERARGWASVGFVVGGITLLVVGAQATVTGAVELGRLWGLSERVIGLTIVAGGTGLPEVVTSLVSSFRGRDDVALGNVVGSNLFNILGTLGITGLVTPVAVPREVVTGDNLWMIGLTLLLCPIILTGRGISRLEGGVLLGSYVLYLGILLGR